MSVDTPQNYVNAMSKHHENMIQTTQDEYDTIETTLNAHVSAWGNIMQMQIRTTRNCISNNNEIPPLYGLRKDHKAFADKMAGPPLRPVCGAIIGNNYRISYLLSTIIRPLVVLSKDVCDSTEDMLYRIRHCNENEDLSDCILGSMDVEALYPSIDIDFAVEKCM